MAATPEFSNIEKRIKELDARIKALGGDGFENLDKALKNMNDDNGIFKKEVEDGKKTNNNKKDEKRTTTRTRQRIIVVIIHWNGPKQPNKKI